MKVIDISWPVSPDIAEYENRKLIQFVPFGQESMISMVNHTGTHVDGPRYFFKDSKSIDQFSLKQLIGPCKVLDLTSVETEITKHDLQPFEIHADDIILFKTQNSKLPTEGKFYNDNNKKPIHNRLNILFPYLNLFFSMSAHMPCTNTCFCFSTGHGMGNHLPFTIFKL